MSPHKFYRTMASCRIQSSGQTLTDAKFSLDLQPPSNPIISYCRRPHILLSLQLLTLALANFVGAET